jgi:hypothetical protein
MANLKRQPVVRSREALRYPIAIIHLSPARRSPRSLAGQGVGWVWGGCGVVHTVCWSGRQDTLSSITVASRGVGDHSGSRKRQTPGLPRPPPPKVASPRCCDDSTHCSAHALSPSSPTQVRQSKQAKPAAARGAAHRAPREFATSNPNGLGTRGACHCLCLCLCLHLALAVPLFFWPVSRGGCRQGWFRSKNNV